MYLRLYKYIIHRKKIKKQRKTLGFFKELESNTVSKLKINIVHA